MTDTQGLRPIKHEKKIDVECQCFSQKLLSSLLLLVTGTKWWEHSKDVLSNKKNRKKEAEKRECEIDVDDMKNDNF